MFELMWWVTAAVYWLVFGLSAIVLMKTGLRHAWMILSAGFLWVAVNKQIDLTGMLVRWLRKVAWTNNWYSGRHGVQIVAVVVLGVVFAAAIVGLGRLTAKYKWTMPQRFALGALVYLVCFSLIRSTSLHGIDSFLYRPVAGGILLNWVFELGGLLVAGIPLLNGAIVGKRTS